MKIDGVDYETLVASDIERDSLQFECYRYYGSARELVFEAVRFDTRRKWSFIAHTTDIPLSLLLKLLPIAKTRLGPFFGDPDVLQNIAVGDE